jgi:hypothetical protein
MELEDYSLAGIIYRKECDVNARGASILLKQCMYRRKLWQLREVLRDAGIEERERELNLKTPSIDKINRV